MKYLYTWSIKQGAIPEVVKRFLSGDAAPPDGVTHLGRWHKMDFTGGFSLLETEDPTALYRHVARWSLALEFEMFPVIEDAQVAPILASVFGK